jgi:hypothetical protein
MRKMSMPGFTAMLSLGVSTQRYVSGQTASPKRGATAVVPSLYIDAKGPCEDIPGECWDAVHRKCVSCFSFGAPTFGGPFF